MRILRIIARLNVGGPAKHVIWLSSGLQRLGHETMLAYGRVEGDEDSLEHLLAQHTFTSSVIPTLSRSIHPIRDLVTIFKIFYLITRFKPDIVHTHTSKAGFCGRIAAMLAKPFLSKRLYVYHTFHGHTFHGYFSERMHRIFLSMERLLARFGTDRIVTISALQQSEIRDKYLVGTPDKHLLIPLGLDFSFVSKLCRDSLRKQFQIPDSAFVFGIVGRIAPVKNHSLFLRAVSEFLQKTKDQDCVFAVIGSGDSEQVDRLQQEVHCLNVGHRVRFTGNQTNPAEIYGAINCLVLTSVNEGTPLSILEAFAARVPVIATEVGGVKDLLGDNDRGILVSQDAEDIAAAMHWIRDTRPNWLDQAENFVQEYYSVDKLIQSMQLAYQAE